MIKPIPAKVILFGEYVLLRGGKALGMPLAKFYGKLSSEPLHSERAQKSHFHLNKYVQWLNDQGDLSIYLNLKSLNEAISKGHWLDANIPLNAGLGSSGAMVAAILKQYGKEGISQLSLVELKTLLARFEDFFHGTSSGIDPLICYLARPILLESAKIKRLEIDFRTQFEKIHAFLLPINGAGKTGELVQTFQQKCLNNTFKQKIDNFYIPLSNGIIDHFTSLKLGPFWTDLKQLSTTQLELFPEMIAPDLQELYLEGLSTEKFLLKLCGSGGGGFALGFTKDWDSILQRFPRAILISE